MKAVSIIVLLAGCGRVGFDSGTAIGDGGGTGSDGAMADARPLDDSGIGDHNGYWVWESGTVTGESTTRLRSDLMNGIHADDLINGSSVVSRIVPLQNGVPQLLDTRSATLEVTGLRWVFDAGTLRSVYTAHWIDGDRVELTREMGAPEELGQQTVDVAMLVRATQLPAVLVGNKAMTRVEYSDTGGEVASGQCALSGTNDSQHITGSFDFSSVFVATIHFDYEIFQGTTFCTGAPQMVASDGVAYLDVDGTSFHMFVDLDDTGPAGLSGPVTFTPTSVRFTQTGCEPALSTDCTGLPRMVELAF